MSNVRQIQRKLQKSKPAPAPDPQAPPIDPLAGQNYRVRRLVLKAELDVYTPDGVLIQRGLTDDLVLVEAEFPQAIIQYFLDKGMLKDGFKTYRPPAPPMPPPATP
jgi:hypothetical protein